MVGYSNIVDDADGVAAVSDDSGDEPSSAVNFFSILRAFSFAFVGFEFAAEEFAALLGFVALGLGLKPGKALPCTSWPVSTIGGSLAQ